MQNRILADYTLVALPDLMSAPQSCEENEMTTRFRDLKVSEYWNLAWPFGVVGLLGAAAHIIGIWLTWHVLEVLADALIIAGVLGVTLELFATRFLIERVAEDVAGRLAGGRLPEKLQRLIRDLVATGIVRENYVKSYRFTQLTADGYVQIGITIRFNVKNYSDKTIEYRPSIQEEIFYSPEFDYMEYGPIGTPKVLTQAQIQELAYDDPQTHVKNLLAPAIDLPPMKKDQPNPQFQVVIKYRVRMREQYSDVTNFGGATLGAKIELDEIPDTLTFVSGGDETLQHVPDSKTWYFDRPFINGQNVRVWWFRR